MSERASLTARWMELYRNVPGGPWLGRATMEENRRTEVAEIEADLADIHDSEGHGPFVISHKNEVGPRLVRDQKPHEGLKGVAKERRCICSDVFTQDDDVDVADDRTFDGYRRKLVAVEWPGHTFEEQKQPVQPRDTAAPRGKWFARA